MNRDKTMRKVPPFTEEYTEEWKKGYAAGYAEARKRYEPPPWTRIVAEVDRQSGAFTEDEIENAKAWR